PCAAGTPPTTSQRGYRDKARAPQGPTVGTTRPFRLREANQAPPYLHADPEEFIFGRGTGEVRLVQLQVDAAHARAREGRGRRCRLMVLAHPNPAPPQPPALRKSPAPPAPALPHPGDINLESH